MLIPLLSTLISCGDIEGDDVGECADRADNDADGLLDCDDSDCAASPDCTSETDADADSDADSDSDVDTDAIPVAACAVSDSEVAPPFEATTLLGEDSYVPNGDLIDRYIWHIVERPVGTDAEPEPGLDQPNAAFTPDLSGTYTARLVAVLGTTSSAPCDVSLTARPAQDLYVEMFWTSSGDDMDLHLLAPGGATEGVDDCFYGNCDSQELDWGPTGADGNPTLLVKDMPNKGPEITAIPSSIDDGVYTVVVRDYPGSVRDGANPTTVNVYVRGVLAWTDTRDMDVAEGSYVTFATVEFPSGVVQTCPDEGC